MKKLAVVRAQHPVDVGTLIFNDLSGIKTCYVGYSEDKDWLNDPCFAYTEIKKLLPDFISGQLVRRPYSPVSFVVLSDLKKALEDALVINSAELYSFTSRQCANFARRSRKRFVVSVWETIPTLPLNFLPPYSWNVRAVCKYADLFLAHTRRAANYLRSLSIPEEKIKVVYPGIDIKKFSPMKKSSADTFRVLFVGRFDAEKGLSFLLQAFARLHSKKPQVELWIRAKQRTGEMNSLAVTYSKKYPIKFVEFVRFDKLREIYQQCDVLCLPSFDMKKWGIKVWEEQFGFVLMEAMACGLPIIASNCGAIPEVVGSKNLLVRQRSVDDLYQALCKIVEDERYRDSISDANRIRAEALFDIVKQKRKLGQALCELLN